MSGYRRTSYPWMKAEARRRRRGRLTSWFVTAVMAAVVFAALFTAVSRWEAISAVWPEHAASAAPAPARVYYASCAAARAAGQGPMHRGHPGYREALDADRDGWACEPYP
jgi:hypothetical protein